MSEGMSIEGLQEAQDDNLRAIAALKPAGALGRMVQSVSTDLHRHAVSITHVDTGALRAAHRIQISNGGLRGTIYVDAGARNPRSKAKPAEYIAYEHKRGGTHAVYDRTVVEAGNPAVDRAVNRFIGELP